MVIFCEYLNKSHFDILYSKTTLLAGYLRIFSVAYKTMENLHLLLPYKVPTDLSIKNYLHKIQRIDKEVAQFCCETTFLHLVLEVLT